MTPSSSRAASRCRSSSGRSTARIILPKSFGLPRFVSRLTTTCRTVSSSASPLAYASEPNWRSARTRTPRVAPEAAYRWRITNNEEQHGFCGRRAHFAFGLGRGVRPVSQPNSARRRRQRHTATRRFPLPQPHQSSASYRRAGSRRGTDGLLMDRLLRRRRLRRLLRLDLYRLRYDRLGVAEPEPRGGDGRRLRRLQLSGEPEFRARRGRRLPRQSQLG